MYVIDAIDLRIDMDDPRIDRIFDLLDGWRHLPAYQLERRADIFFGLFLPDVLDHLDFDGLKSQAIDILELHKFTRHYIGGVERVFFGSVQGIGDV